MCKFRKLISVKQDLDDRKVRSFVSSIIFLIISIALTSVIFYMNLEFTSAVESSATGGLILAIFLPLGIILVLLTASTIISGLIASFMACFSSNKPIKIISIVTLVLNLAVTAVYVYSIVKYISLLGG